MVRRSKRKSKKLLRNVRFGRKTASVRRKKVMVAGGWGRSGPYLLGSAKTTRRGNTTLSIGTRGKEIGHTQRFGKKNKVRARYNLTSSTLSIEVKLGKFRKKF